MFFQQFLNLLKTEISGPAMTVNLEYEKITCEIISYIWCRQAKNKMGRFYIYSNSTQDPFKRPLLEAVISKTKV